MASIQPLKRRDGTKYRAFVQLAGRRRISKVFDTRSAAREWARTMEGNVDAVDAFPDATARKHTVAQVLDGFMADYSGKDPSILGRLGWWRTHYGSTPLHQFSDALVLEGLRTLARTDATHSAGKRGQVSLGRRRTPATLNRYRSAIRIAMSWALQEKLIPRNPAAGLRQRKEPRGRVRWLSEDERTALLKACDASPWADLGLLVRMALSTGARLGELMALRWEDLDLKRKVAQVHDSKSGEPRTLPLVKPVHDALTAKARPIAGGLLFPSPRDPARPFAFRPHWEAALAAAGIEGFRFHDLRHSAASYLAMNGATLLEIADVLGHKTLAMVKRYSHLSSEHKATLVEKVLGKVVE